MQPHLQLSKIPYQNYTFPQLPPENRISAMETLLRQSRAVCPFLKKTSPATLRSLSTSTTAASAHSASPGGGRMSNLQVLARRCPVMGKAIAVQSSRHSTTLGGVYGGASAVKAYHTRGKGPVIA